MGSQESMKVPIWIIIVFQQRDTQDSQSLNKDTFCILPVTSAQCVIGTEKYPDAVILINFEYDEDNQGCGQIREAFTALTKGVILQPYISDLDFRSSNVTTDDVGYKLYVFDIRYKQLSTASQLIEVEFEFDAVVTNDIIRYALVLTNKFVNESSDGQ